MSRTAASCSAGGGKAVMKLCTTMSATDVSDTLQIALQTSGLNQVKVLHRPRLLSDNGASYLSNDLGNL